MFKTCKILHGELPTTQEDCSKDLLQNWLSVWYVTLIYLVSSFKVHEESWSGWSLNAHGVCGKKTLVWIFNSGCGIKNVKGKRMTKTVMLTVNRDYAVLNSWLGLWLMGNHFGHLWQYETCHCPMFVLLHVSWLSLCLCSSLSAVRKHFICHQISFWSRLCLA